MTDKTSQLVSRWKIRLFLTVVIGFGFVLLYPTLICGCHFHASAVIPVIPPVCWGLYALLTYRERKEKAVGWLAFAIALPLAWLEFISNIVFVF